MIYLLSGPTLAALAVIGCLIPITRPQAWRQGVLYAGMAVCLPVAIGLCSGFLPLLYLSIVCKAVVGMVASAVAFGGIFTSIQHRYPWRTMAAGMLLMAAGLIDLASAYRIGKYSF